MSTIGKGSLEDLMRLGLDHDALRESIDPAKTMATIRKLNTVSMDWNTTEPPRPAYHPAERRRGVEITTEAT